MTTATSLSSRYSERLGGRSFQGREFLALLSGELLRSVGKFEEEFRSLASEPNQEMFFHGLLNLGLRLEIADQLDAAAAVYSTLAEPRGPALPPVPQEIQKQANRQLAALRGTGGFGPRAEFLLRRLSREALEPATLLGLGAASAAFRATRVATLARLGAGPAELWSRGFGARLTASLFGFGVEGAVFPLATRLGHLVMGRSLEWGSAQLGREIAGSYIVLGALKLSGWGASSVFNRVHGVGREVGARHAVPLRSGFAQAAMLGGIYLGHQAEIALGFQAPLDNATTLVDSLAMLVQFNAGAQLARGLFGPKFHRWEREMDLRVGSDFAKPLVSTDKSYGSDTTYALEPAGGPGSAAILMSAPGGEGLRGRIRRILGRAEPSANPETQGHDHSPYREVLKPYANLTEARQQAEEIQRRFLDSEEPIAIRISSLNLYWDYLEALRRETDFLLKFLMPVFSVMCDSGVPRPPVPWTPNFILSNMDEIPTQIPEYYERDRLVRAKAGQIFSKLHKERGGRDLNSVEAVKWVRELLKDPRVPTHFTTLYGDNFLSQAHREAEARMRAEFLDTYVKLLPALRPGSEEAVGGLKVLNTEKLRRLARGEPFDSLGDDIGVSVKTLKAFALLAPLLPPDIPEVDAAHEGIQATIFKVKELVRQNHPEAMEAWILLARVDPAALEFLDQMAKRGNKRAEEGAREIRAKKAALAEAVKNQDRQSHGVVRVIDEILDFFDIFFKS